MYLRVKDKFIVDKAWFVVSCAIRTCRAARSKCCSLLLTGAGAQNKNKHTHTHTHIQAGRLTVDLSDFLFVLYGSFHNYVEI